MTYPLINVRFILLTSASFVAIFSSIAIYFCLPILISHVIRTQITLSINSGSYNDWRVNSVIDRIYLFNITNLDTLLSASSQPAAAAVIDSSPSPTRPLIRLSQLGPYTFRQDREKINIRFDTNNETVLYDQKKSWTFMPELSEIKSLDELRSQWINHVNVPLAGTTMNPEYAEFVEPTIQEHDLRLFMNHSISTMLFEGYPDILMELAKEQRQVDVDRFGWMHDQNNSVTKGFRVFTGTSNATLDKFGSIDEYQFQRRFSIWHNNGSSPTDFSNVACNEFRFSSAGEFFPPSEYSILSYNNKAPRQIATTSHKQQMGINNQDDKQQHDEKQTQPGAAPASHSQTDNSATSTVMDRHLSLVESEFIQAELSDKRLKKLEQKQDQTISIFMPDLCRTIRLYYNGSYHYKSLLVDRYLADERTYDYTNIEGDSNSNSNNNNNNNKCYCIYNENTRSLSCPPNGMMDLYSCRKGSPITISFPYFLYSRNDKSLAPYLKLFDYDNPTKLKATAAENEGELQFFIDLESTLNVPVKAQIVLQFNVHIRNDGAMNFTKEYAHLFDDPQHPTATTANNNKPPAYKDIYLPQMWIKSSAEIDERNLNNLKFIQKHLDLITPITTIVIFGFASILLMASAKLAYDLTYGPRSRKSMQCDQESCSSLNRTYNCYLDDEKKKKYFNMQLLGNESPCEKLRQTPSDYGNSSTHHLQQPTTSKGCDTSTSNSISNARPQVSAQVMASDGARDQECEPLNRST